MTDATAPDARTVRQLATEHILEDARRGHDLAPAVLGYHGPDALTRHEYGAWCSAIREAIRTAQITVSWPDGQMQAGGDPCAVCYCRGCSQCVNPMPPSEVCFCMKAMRTAPESARPPAGQAAGDGEEREAVETVRDWIADLNDEALVQFKVRRLRAVLDRLRRLEQLLGIGVDREQWDAIAEAEGRRFEGEQTNDTLVGYLAYQRESSRALSSFLQSEVKELEADRDALTTLVEADVRVVAALRDVLRAGGRGWGEADALIARFADRIADLAARDEGKA